MARKVKVLTSKQNATKFKSSLLLYFHLRAISAAPLPCSSRLVLVANRQIGSNPWSRRTHGVCHGMGACPFDWWFGSRWFGGKAGGCHLPPTTRSSSPKPNHRAPNHEGCLKPGCAEKHIIPSKAWRSKPSFLVLKLNDVPAPTWECD